MDTVKENPERDTYESSEGLNFQVAGLTSTPRESWIPEVRMTMMTPTRRITQPQPPSG